MWLMLAHLVVLVAVAVELLLAVRLAGQQALLQRRDMQGMPVLQIIGLAVEAVLVVWVEWLHKPLVETA
jgi:hypothetical protein